MLTIIVEENNMNRRLAAVLLAGLAGWGSACLGDESDTFVLQSLKSIEKLDRSPCPCN
jgi:hypothetical protein